MQMSWSEWLVFVAQLLERRRGGRRVSGSTLYQISSGWSCSCTPKCDHTRSRLVNSNSSSSTARTTLIGVVASFDRHCGGHLDTAAAADCAARVHQAVARHVWLESCCWPRVCDARRLSAALLRSWVCKSSRSLQVVIVESFRLSSIMSIAENTANADLCIAVVWNARRANAKSSDFFAVNKLPSQS